MSNKTRLANGIKIIGTMDEYKKGKALLPPKRPQTIDLFLDFLNVARRHYKENIPTDVISEALQEVADFVDNSPENRNAGFYEQIYSYNNHKLKKASDTNWEKFVKRRNPNYALTD